MSKQIAFTVCSLCFFANLSIDAAERTIETIAGTGSEALNEITSPLSTNIGNPLGVEVTGDPTRKDPVKVHAFIRAARGVGGSEGNDRSSEPEIDLSRAPFDWAEQGD